MGLFDDIGDFFTKTIPKTVKKAGRGIKNVAEGTLKGVKAVGKEIKRGVKEIGDNVEQFGEKRAWMEGFKKAGELVQKPAKAIAKWDREKGLGQYMGSVGSAFSPLTLGSSIALAPLSGVGYFTQLIGDKKKQKKLASGNVDEIMDAGFSALAVIPAGGVGAGVKAVGKGGKAVARAVGKGLSRGAKAV
jgi:hypothetical protein